MKKSALLFLLAATVVAGCRKAEFDKTVNGEALGEFRLSAPATNTVLVLNAALPNTPVNITWTASKPGVDIAPTYKWVAALKTGNIEAPILEIPSNNTGKDTRLTLTFQQIDAALASKGVAAGAEADLIWSVVADNGSTKLRCADLFGIKITRFKDGATPFVPLAPATSLTPVTINPTSTTDNMVFRWTKSQPATGGPAVRYKVLFAERKTDAAGNELPVNWNSPLFSINADNTGADTTSTIAFKRLSDSLTAKGFTSLPTPAFLKWTVVATSGTWNQYADYTNSLVIVREIKIYVVGSATPGGWDIGQSTRMIEDPRFPGTYFTYIRLTGSVGNDKLKFVNGQVWPPAPGAVDWGQDPALPVGNITDNGETEVTVTGGTGIYRLTFDLANKKYYLQTAVSNGIGGMGMIGQFQGWSQPALKMSYLGVNKFIYLTNMNTNDEFKFHDGNQWDNGANDKSRWYAVNNAAGGKMVVDPGSGFDNFKWTGANGRMRAIWDGSDPTNLKYELHPASEMRVVGNGINVPGVNDWDPPTSPQMTYAGNGVWTITLALRANREIKFLSGNAWGAFDYEDAGGGKIKYDGGGNFATPGTAGTYTITLNEYAGTYTIL
jgi:starch-binding outer membrane protein SusE/F